MTEGHEAGFAPEVLARADGASGVLEVSRVRVPGGWLYTVQVYSIRGVSVAMQFVPDPTPAPPMSEDEARLRAAVVVAAEWHEAERDSLGKQPPSGDRLWRRQQHRDQHDALRRSLESI